MIKRKRYDFIDVFYAISIFLVILGHSHPSDWALIEGTGYDVFTNYLYSFHMALFFFVAGFLFQNSKSIEVLGYGKWIGNKAVRLLTPYFILSIVAVIPKYFFEQNTFNGIFKNLSEIILVPRIGVWGHFWFIPVIFFIYVFFGLIRTILKQHKTLFLCCSFGFSLILYFVPLKTEILAFNDIKDSAIFFIIGTLLYEFIVLISGKLEINNIIRMIVVLVCSISSFIMYIYLFKFRIIQMLIALMMIIAVWNLSLVIKKNKIATWISKHNFTIYIYSWLFQAAIMVVLYKFEASWLVISLFMLLFGLIGPVIIILAYEKFEKIHNRFFDLLLGFR